MECLYDYRVAVTIHGDDVLAHSNWEIGEKFLRKYGYEHYYPLSHLDLSEHLSGF